MIFYLTIVEKQANKLLTNCYTLSTLSALNFSAEISEITYVFFRVFMLCLEFRLYTLLLLSSFRINMGNKNLNYSHRYLRNIFDM